MRLFYFFLLFLHAELVRIMHFNTVTTCILRRPAE